MTGTDIRAIRLAHGLTQRALAALLGYHTNHLAKIERGEVKVTQHLEKLILFALPKKSAKKS